jgi:hypothetical protein
VIFCRCLPALVLAAGAISFATEIVPARETGPARTMPAPGSEDDRAASAPRLAWRPSSADPGKAAVEVVGADAATLRALIQPEMTLDRWTSFLKVRAVPAGEPPHPDRPLLWGSYRVVGEIIRFEPRFPLEPGMKYLAELDPVRLYAVTKELTPSGTTLTRAPRSTRKLIVDYALPKKPARSTTEVAAVTRPGTSCRKTCSVSTSPSRPR